MTYIEHSQKYEGLKNSLQIITTWTGTKYKLSLYNQSTGSLKTYSPITKREVGGLVSEWIAEQLLV